MRRYFLARACCLVALLTNAIGSTVAGDAKVPPRSFDFGELAGNVLENPQNATTNDVRALLKNLDSFKRLPIAGLNLAKVGDRTVLMSDNGRFAVIGNFRLLDVWNAREVKTVADAEDLNRLDLKKIGVKDEDLAMLAYGQGKTAVTVFVDPMCKYCHHLIEQMGALKDQYTFRLVMAPVIGEESVRNSRKLVCEPDKAKALQALVGQKFDGISEPPGCNLGPLQKTLLMTKFFGIDGVPFLVLPSAKTYRGGTNNLRGLLENDIKSLADAK